MARKILLGIIFSLLFVGCVASVVCAADRAPFRIENEQATPIKAPLVWDGKLPLIEVQIGDQTLRLAVDTGEERTTLGLKPKALERLKVEFPAVPSDSRDAKGETDKARRFIIPSIKIGALLFTRMEASEELGHMDDHDDGIIGNQFLQHFQVLIDYRASEMVLYPKTTEPERLRSGEWLKVPFVHNGQGIMVAAKSLWGDRPLRLYLNTAAVCIVQGRSMGLIKPEAVPNEQWNQFGDYSYHETRHLYLSDCDLGAMDFFIFDFKQPSIDGFLGHNLFQDYQVFIDYCHNLLFLRRANFFTADVKPDNPALPSGDKIIACGDGAPIPFEYQNQNIFVKARLGDNPQEYRFILDTGAGVNVVSPELADRLHLEKLDDMKAVDGSGAWQRVPVVSVKSLKVGPVEVADCSAIVMNLGITSAADGTGVDGIIGSNFLQLFAVRIDYEKQQVTFAREASVSETGSYQKVALRKNPSGIIYARLNIAGAPEPVEVEIDTGMAGDSYFIFPATMLDKLRPGFGCDPVESQGILRSGLVGSSSGVVLSRLAAADLGEVSLSEVPVEFSGALPIMGNEFLSHFEVIIDYPTSTLYLRRNEGRKMATNFFSYGLGLFKVQDSVGRLRIVGLYEGSPADRAGLKVGDEILGLSDGTKEISWTEYLTRFKSEATAGPLGLRIRNESGERTVTLVKAPLLPDP